MTEHLPTPSRLTPADELRLGFAGLRTARVRAALAALGVAVGIAAIVAVVGVSQSSKTDLLARLDRLGTDLLTVQPGSTFLRSAQNELPTRSLAMIARVPPVRDASATVNTPALVRRTDKVPTYMTGGIAVLGAELNLLDGLGARIAQGTWLNPRRHAIPPLSSAQAPPRRSGSDNSLRPSRSGSHSAGSR